MKSREDITRILEHRVSPWLRIILPVLGVVTLLLVNQVLNDVRQLRDISQENAVKIQANTTAINYLRGEK